MQEIKDSNPSKEGQTDVHLHAKFKKLKAVQQKEAEGVNTTSI